MKKEEKEELKWMKEEQEEWKWKRGRRIKLKIMENRN